jgi:hypothetical protein
MRHTACVQLDHRSQGSDANVAQTGEVFVLTPQMTNPLSQLHAADATHNCMVGSERMSAYEVMQVQFLKALSNNVNKVCFFTF